jgi:hypothetical protein
MQFKGNGIQVQQYICNPESIISYDESVLDEDMVRVGYGMGRILNSDQDLQCQRNQRISTTQISSIS